MNRHAWMVASCVAWAASASAQSNCVDTPEGRVCSVQQPIVAGAPVGVDLQEQLGLVTVNGGCSGTLMNRDWVLTARHCVTNEPPNATAAVDIASPLMPIDQVRITAAWRGTAAVTPTRYHDLAVNSGAGVTPTVDMILIHLGNADLGTVNRQIPYILQRGVTTVSRWRAARLAETDVVNQYGRGFSTLATGVFGGVPPAVPSGGAGPYQTAQFSPTNITQTGYTLVMNGGSQVGHGGDSGGPTYITASDGRNYIAGVQSTCRATGYVTNAPAQIWMWATGVASCNYVSVEPYVREIGRVVQERPPCKIDARCAMPAILSYVLE